jgi:hypothetical protein
LAHHCIGHDHQIRRLCRAPSNLGTWWLACQDGSAWPRVVLHRCAVLYGQNQATFVWAAYGGTVLALDLGVRWIDALRVLLFTMVALLALRGSLLPRRRARLFAAAVAASTE